MVLSPRMIWRLPAEPMTLPRLPTESPERTVCESRGEPMPLHQRKMEFMQKTQMMPIWDLFILQTEPSILLRRETGSVQAVICWPKTVHTRLRPAEGVQMLFPKVTGRSSIRCKGEIGKIR